MAKALYLGAHWAVIETKSAQTANNREKRRVDMVAYL